MHPDLERLLQLQAKDLVLLDTEVRLKALDEALAPIVATGPATLWMRQMVLGPSPEFVLFAARDVALGVPSMRLDVSCVWPAG